MNRNNIDTVLNSIGSIPRDEYGILLIPEWMERAKYFIIAVAPFLKLFANDKTDAIIDEIVEILEDL